MREGAELPLSSTTPVPSGTNSELQPVVQETQTTCPEDFATAIIKGELHLLQVTFYI